MVDFEVLSLQPKKCWCIQNLKGWKDTSFLWFLFPQLLVDSKVNFRNDFKEKAAEAINNLKVKLASFFNLFSKGWKFLPHGNTI